MIIRSENSRREIRVAIIGAGPSGLYAANDFLQRLSAGRVDMFDRLPTIGGLVRSGVAPDHGARRKVTEVYEALVMRSRRFRFHGNVEIGTDLRPEELLEHFHAVIYANGASSDRKLNIPGEALLGSHAASDFVGWYNGHPDFADLEFDLSGERAVVVGNGNVALDVARMLLLPHAQLRATDIADYALAALQKSSIREVIVLGRRGPAQAAFTSPELLELANLENVDVIVDPGMATGDFAYRATPTQALRIKLLDEYARRSRLGREKTLELRFLTSPVQIIGDACAEGVRVVRNALVVGADGLPRAKATESLSSIDTKLVLRSIGYRAKPLPGLPFDEALGVLPNQSGRVIDPATGRNIASVYVAGWLKRGSKGVIGTNKICSQETVTCLLEDEAAGHLNPPLKGAGELQELLMRRQPRRIDYTGYKAIDRYEKSQGEAQQRSRVKLTNTEDMLRVALSRAAT